MSTHNQFIDDDSQEELDEEIGTADRIGSLDSCDLAVGNRVVDRHTRDGSSKSTKSLGSASSGADSPLLSPGGTSCFKDYKLFSNINVTIKHPGWLAVFMKYMLKDELPEHLFLYLSLVQFRLRKDEDLAKSMAYSHISKSAPLAPDPALCPGLTDDVEGGKFTGVALELQTLLEKKSVNLGFVRTTLDDLFVVMESDMNERLNDMVALFKAQPNIAMACGAIGTSSRPGVCDGWDESDTREQQTMAAKGHMQELLTPFMDNMAGMRVDVKYVRPKDPTTLAVYNNTLTDVLGQLMAKNNIDTHQSKAGTIMSKKKGKTHLYNGHPFVTHSFVTPTFCAHCGDMLWGLRKQGWECAMCGMTLHKNSGASGVQHCCHDLKKRCPGAKPGEIKKIMKQMSSRASAKAQASARSAVSNVAGGGGGGGGAAVEGDDDEESDDDEDEPTGNRRDSRASFFVTQALPADPTTAEPKGFATFVAKDQLAIMKKMYGKSKEMKRQELMYELIQTEKGYYRHLMVMLKIFKAPFDRPKGQQMLSKADTRTIFGNIEALLAAHKPISDEIAAIQREGNGSVCSPVPGLGQRFLDVYRKHCTSPIYQSYCVNAPKGRELLLKRMAENPDLKAKIAELETREECGRLGLKDFLVKPYQRLTKYPLLMKDIKEALMPYAVEPKKDDKAKRLTQAEKDEEVAVLTALEKIGHDNMVTVNQTIADSEDRAKLQEVNGFLKDDRGMLTEAEMEFMDDLHIGRKLELDGEVNVLKKVAGSKKQSKHKVRLMLLTDMLLILEQVGNNKKGLKVYKPFQMAMPGFSPMMMLGAMVLKDDRRGGGKNGFFVLTTAKFTLDGQQGYPQLLEFDADTKIMCKKWKEAIDKVSKIYKEEHPTWEADLAETAAQRRAAKSSTLPVSAGQSFKESFKAMGRRSSMQTAHTNPRANAGTPQSSAARSSSLRGAPTNAGPLAPSSPKGGGGAAATAGGASSPLRPSGSIEAATAVDMAEVEAELAGARREIEVLKEQNMTLTKKLAAAQGSTQLAAENTRLKAENARLQGEVDEAENMLFGEAPKDDAGGVPGGLSPLPAAADAAASPLGRSPSYINGARSAAPTSAPPPPPPSSTTKPAFDHNPFPLPFGDGDDDAGDGNEYMDVASPARREGSSGSLGGSYSGFGADFDASDGSLPTARDSAC